MKKIGFIDYYLDEWHANNYPAWIKAANEQLGEDFALCFAWGEKASPEGVTGGEWCKKYAVEPCESIEEACEKADFLFILAPSDPEKHLLYAEKAFAYKKPTYIDKTFASDLAEAKKIFALGKKYGVPFFSTSALRYGTELDDIVGSRSVLVTGGGRSIEEYCVHQIEMLVSVLKAKPQRVKTERQGENQYVVSVECEGGKTGSFIYSNSLPFTVCAEKEGKDCYKPINSDYFARLIKEILRFFVSGKPPFDGEQTLWAMAIREKALEGVLNPGVWLDINL
ncbi:MAG: hypothetical protein ACI4SC_05730 [Candidatus Neoclostridium sp.]